MCVCVFIYNYVKENEQLCYFIKLLGAYKFFDQKQINIISGVCVDKFAKRVVSGIKWNQDAD